MSDLKWCREWNQILNLKHITKRKYRNRCVWSSFINRYNFVFQGVHCWCDIYSVNILPLPSLQCLNCISSVPLEIIAAVFLACVWGVWGRNSTTNTEIQNKVKVLILLNIQNQCSSNNKIRKDFRFMKCSWKMVISSCFEFIQIYDND